MGEACSSLRQVFPVTVPSWRMWQRSGFEVSYANFVVSFRIPNPTRSENLDGTIMERCWYGVRLRLPFSIHGHGGSSSRQVIPSCYALRLAPRMKLSRGMMLSSGWPFSLFSTPDRPEGYPPSRQVILPIYNLRPGPVMRFSIEMMLSSGWLFVFQDTQCDVRSQTNRDSRQFAAARDGGFSLPLRVPDTMAMCVNYWDKWFWPVMRAPRYSCQLPLTLFAFQNPHPRPWSWQSAVIIKTSIAGWWLGVRLTWGVCRPGRSNCPGSWYQNEEKERERERERKVVRLSSTARRSAFKIQRVTRYILGVCLLIRKP